MAIVEEVLRNAVGCLRDNVIADSICAQGIRHISHDDRVCLVESQFLQRLRIAGMVIRIG